MTPVVHVVQASTLMAAHPSLVPCAMVLLWART